jgi:hypothetical protein
VRKPAQREMQAVLLLRPHRHALLQPHDTLQRSTTFWDTVQHVASRYGPLAASNARNMQCCNMKHCVAPWYTVATCSSKTNGNPTVPQRAVLGVLTHGPIKHAALGRQVRNFAINWFCRRTHQTQAHAHARARGHAPTTVVCWPFLLTESSTGLNSELP